MDAFRKNTELIVLLFTIAVVAVWQIFFIYQLPDGDTDAYAHFIIARDIVRNGSNLSLHWVWLPLFHYIGAFFVSIGSEMQTLRYINVIVWNAIPVILYFYIKKKEPQSLIAVSAAMLAALSPIGILMGTTAQPEPLFALFILLIVITLENRKYFSSAIILSLACMLRYEAWAVLAGITIYLLIIIIKERKLKTALFGNTYSAFLVILLPAFTIIIWTILRYLSDGSWFLFLHGTQKFASDALRQNNEIGGGIINVIKDTFFYVFWIPFIFTGVTVLLVPAGFKKFYSQNKIMFVTGTAILLFITLSWILKANLGLNRHFTSIIPFYSLMSAYGLFIITEYFKKYKILKSGKVIPVLALVIILVYSVMWLYIWRKNNEASFTEKKSAAEFIRQVYSSGTSGKFMIISNEPVVEILSKIDYRLFDHFWMEENQETADYLLSFKKSDKSYYIIANSKLGLFLKRFGDVIYETNKDSSIGNGVIIIKD